MNSAFCVAVHALVYLYHKQTMLSSEELASNICTHPVRVRKIMATLKKAHLIETKEGQVGGYQLLESGQDITLEQVAQALDVRLVEASWHSGDSDCKCLIASGMPRFMDGLMEDLNMRCNQSLQTISIADIEAQLFQHSR